jgi:hypothetical protein
MPAPELAIDTASVVIRGAFDPAAFSINELENQGLTSREEISGALQKFSTSDFVLLETQQLRFLGNREVLQFNAQQPDQFSLLRDFAVNVLRLFKDDKISVLGMNREAHFVAKTQAEWHKIGDALVPKDVWDGVMHHVGMASMTVQGAREDKYLGFRQVTVQPSALVPQGVFVSHNDHYTLEMTDEPPTSRDQIQTLAKQPALSNSDKIPVAIRVLNEEWENSMARAASVIERVAQQGSK